MVLFLVLDAGFASLYTTTATRLVVSDDAKEADKACVKCVAWDVMKTNIGVVTVANEGL